MCKGLTLYRCLIEKLDYDFTLHCLCIDLETFEKVNSINDKRIAAYSLSELEKTNDTLKQIKSNGNKSNYGDEYSQYCWSLTPFFCNFILNTDGVKDVLYIDSDLYFYEDFTLIEEEIKDKSVGIITHRTDLHLTKETDVGRYNVGIVYFKGDKMGKQVSDFWKELMKYPDNKYSEKYGTCGDQKYLELFEINFDKEKICIIDDLVGHGAPWCFSSYKYNEKYKITWNGSVQNLVFNHFSHFNVLENGWSSSNDGEWKPETINTYVNDYYEDYYKEMIQTEKEFKLVYRKLYERPKQRPKQRRRRRRQRRQKSD
jgi:hypothetical protein